MAMAMKKSQSNSFEVKLSLGAAGCLLNWLDLPNIDPYHLPHPILYLVTFL